MIKELGSLGFPDHGVDDNGNVYTRKKRGSVELGDYRKMKSQVSKHGYMVTMLRHNGKLKNFKNHRLVAIMFIKNRDNLPFVNHIDCDTKNNTVSNLEWCTPKGNIVHAFKNKRIRRHGAHNGAAKLDDPKVLVINTMILNGSRNNEIAEYFKIANNTVSAIRHKVSWKHLGL